MEMEGKIWKDGKFWIAEVPAIDAMTQGKTRKEALSMLKDLVLEMMLSYFKRQVGKKFSINLFDYKKNTIGISASDIKLLLSLSLNRQRAKSGSTIREVSQRMGSKSPNSYAQYERGKTSVSLEKYEALLTAANPFDRLRLKIA